MSLDDSRSSMTSLPESTLFTSTASISQSISSVTNSGDICDDGVMTLKIATTAKNGHQRPLSSPYRSNMPTDLQLQQMQSNGGIDESLFVKRPLNAYMIFSKEERKKILAKDPSLKMHDVSRLMGEKWKRLSDTEKKPFFDKSKLNKLEHRKVLRDNPNLFYHPQRKKILKALASKNDLNQSLDSSDETASFSSFGSLSTTSCTPRFRSNGYSSRCYSAPLSSRMPSTSQGNIVLTRALNSRTPMQSIRHQSNIQNTSHTRGGQQNMGPRPLTRASLQRALDLYYVSLCQPAFPEIGEVNTMSSPYFYLEQYNQIFHHLASRPADLNASSSLTYRKL